MPLPFTLSLVGRGTKGEGEITTYIKARMIPANGID
jgi:hypothetical protein